MQGRVHSSVLKSYQFMSVRYYIFLMTTLVTLIPVAVFGIWPHSRAYDDIVADVSERNLLVAENLGRALERYDRDVKAGFGCWFEPWPTARVRRKRMCCSTISIFVTFSSPIRRHAGCDSRSTVRTSLARNSFPWIVWPDLGKLPRLERQIFSGVLKGCQFR